MVFIQPHGSAFMDTPVLIREKDVVKDDPITLKTPRNPFPEESLFLSNIDQTVAFPVETLYFFTVADEKPAVDIAERVKDSVCALLVPYYFMAGRLKFNSESNRLELVCNNVGVLVRKAKSTLTLEELGDVSRPNPSFQHLILRVDGFKSLGDTPIFTIQVTSFKCGGYSIGLVINHSILDGISALEMTQNLASLCRGSGLKTQLLHNDRSCIKARIPPLIKYPHFEYRKLSDFMGHSSSFTAAFNHGLTSILNLSENHSYKLFVFSAAKVNQLKRKAMPLDCSTFEVMVAHIWRARTMAMFGWDPSRVSSVLFAVDIRKRVCPPLPDGFVGNAVVTACARASVLELGEKSFSSTVGKVQEAIKALTDDYIKSAVDWLEVHKGFPSTLDGNFFVSAWWKLPFHDLDFGYGKPFHGGPIVSGMSEFVLLLPNNERGVSVWIILAKDQMERFMAHIYDI